MQKATNCRSLVMVLDAQVVSIRCYGEVQSQVFVY